MERLAGRTLFLRIKLQPLSTFRLILDKRGVECAPPPVFLPITDEEYAVNSAFLAHLTRNESPSTMIHIDSRTSGPGFGGLSVKGLRAAAGMNELGDRVWDDFYLRNFRRYDLSPGFEFRLGFRLVAETDSNDGRGWLHYLSRVAFDEAGRRAITWLRSSGRSFMDDWVGVLHAKPDGATTRAELWVVRACSMVGGCHFNFRGSEED